MFLGALALNTTLHILTNKTWVYECPQVLQYSKTLFSAGVTLRLKPPNLFLHLKVLTRITIGSSAGCNHVKLTHYPTSPCLQRFLKPQRPNFWSPAVVSNQAKAGKRVWGSPFHSTVTSSQNKSSQKTSWVFMEKSFAVSLAVEKCLSAYHNYKG